MKKPFLLIMMSILFIFSMGQSALAFSDIGSEPNAGQIDALRKAGKLSGESEGKFNPQGKLTYAAGVTMLVKGLDLSLARFLFIKAPQASDYFAFVKDGQWYSEAFIIAQVNGLDIPRDVLPDQIMTREQFAHHLFRAIEANGEHAYVMKFVAIKDAADINPAYAYSIQKLILAHIAELDKEQNFYPKAEISRGTAASWLYKAIEFVKETPLVPEPEKNPLYDTKLETKSVNEQVYEVTVSAQASHPGYGIRITSIVFDGGQAVIHTEPVLPDPNKSYPQVITEVRSVTYISSAYKPVLAESYKP